MQNMREYNPVSLGDLASKETLVHKFVKSEPEKDHIFAFIDSRFAAFGDCYPNMEIDQSDLEVTAGSFVVNKIIEMLNKIMVNTTIKPFKVNDQDIFTLGSPADTCIKLPGVDLVKSTFKTVPELLLNFDLSCCRAAFGSGGRVWISAQCFNAIMTGIVFYPSCLATPSTLESELRKHGFNSEGYLDMWARWNKRKDKYTKRGFQLDNKAFTTVPSFIINYMNRFQELRRKREEKKAGRSSCPMRKVERADDSDEEECVEEEEESESSPRKPFKMASSPRKASPRPMNKAPPIVVAKPYPTAPVTGPVVQPAFIPIPAPTVDTAEKAVEELNAKLKQLQEQISKLNSK